MITKVLALLFVTFAFFLFSPTSTLAQTASPSATTLTPIPSTVSPTSPLYTDLLLHNMLHTFSCIGAGISVIGQPCLNYQLTKDAQGNLQSIPVLSQADLSGGALGFVTGLIGGMYNNPPVRTTEYLASVGQGLGIVKQANAQAPTGSGYNVLSPVLALWQVSRNVAYLIMIVIFTVIGVMIMFRNRVNPQTVITAQAALPGLVIGLIMITFSYFLAGLISDMAFVGTNVAGYYFQAVQGKPAQDLVKDVNNTSVIKLFVPFTWMLGVGNISFALESVWDDLGDPNATTIDFFNFTYLDPQRVVRILTTFMLLQFLSPIGSLVPGWGSVISGAIALGGGQVGTLQVAAWSLAFIGMLALLYTMLRLLLRLVNNFLSIIFLTVTAPFHFLFASLPGRQGMATDWILSMFGHVLVFPAVIAVFYFVALLLGPQYMHKYCDSPRDSGNCPFKTSQLRQLDEPSLPSNAYAQEAKIKIVDSNSFPLFGGLDLSFIRLLLAFGALLATPAIPDVVIRTVGKASQAGQIIGQEIGAGTAAGQRYSGQFSQGVSGISGQVGRVTDTPGYYGLINEKTKKVEWHKTYDPRYGAHIGQGAKLGMGFNKVKNALNPFSKGGGH